MEIVDNDFEDDEDHCRNISITTVFTKRNDPYILHELQIDIEQTNVRENEMSKNYANIIGATKKNEVSNTPQSEPLFGTNQQQNNAGGFSFVVNPWIRVERFLILGSEGGSYYVSEAALTLNNTKNLQACIAQDGVRVVNIIVAISDSGRAPKNSPAIFALALAAATGNADTRKHAFGNLPKVARTATDLFSFVEQYKQLKGGFGTVPKKGLQNWYQAKKIDQVAYQMIKYRQRNGWTHHDVLSLAHVKPSDEVESNLYKYAKVLADGEGVFVTSILPEIAQGYEAIKVVTDASEAAKLITDYKLPREAVPTQLLNSIEVWDALLQHMPITALIRNLGKMTNIGLIKPLSNGEKIARDKLQNIELLRAGRVHPINILVAAKTYAAGHGDKGSLTWTPSRVVNDALDAAFYNAFPNVVPSGKNLLIGLDVSGSMGDAACIGSPLTAREASAAMSLITMATEPNVHILAFQSRFVPLNISPTMRLDQVIKKISGLSFGGTDCSVPMTYALKNKLEVDGFVVYTDNETWYGDMHPSEALKKYRLGMNRPAKSIVCATSATDFSIADPNDTGSLDVCGFDANVPAVISDFMK